MRMLLRLVSHAKNNKLHIDKFIVLENAPDSLFFTIKDGKKMMKDFVEVDIVENVPRSIRDEFEIDEQVYRWIPPYEKGATGYDQGFPFIGLVLDCQNRNGSETWQSIERMIEANTPRDRKPPEPVVVAKDHRSGFSIDVEDIPVVDLKPEGGIEVTKIAPVRKSPGRPKKVPVAA